MKHQYFGDENDYRKYGILRLLAGRGELLTAICWMLTDDDSTSDGRFTEYLQSPNVWRRHDAELFDALHRAVKIQDRRNVEVCHEAAILPHTAFHAPVLSDRAAERDIYFRDFAALSAGVDLVFFDPDNGLEIASCRRGTRRSAKYLYWTEFKEAFDRGHSLLVYQHFPRKPRAEFTLRLAQRTARLLRSPRVHTFSTSRVLFLLAPQPRHAAYLASRATEVGSVWAGEILHERFDFMAKDE
jgi:hypothetical protein